MRNRLAITVGVMALVCANPLAAQSERAPGDLSPLGQPSDQTFTGTGFGLINVAPGQTLRMIVANVGSARSSDRVQRVGLTFDVWTINERPGPGPNTCQTWQFAFRQSCDAMLGPGHAASLDFLAPAAGLFSVRAVYLLPAGATTQRGINQDEYIATLQLMEGGRTMFFHEHSSLNR